MVDHNSLVTYVTLLKQLILDIADSYPSNDALLDIEKIESRIATEGLSFLTKALPRLGKKFDNFLASTSDSVLLMPGLQKRPGTAIPKLFGWLLEQIVDTDGRILVEPSTNAIKYYRQLVYFLYKLKLPYETTTSQEVVDSFVQTEVELRKTEFDPDDEVLKDASRFIARVCSRLNVRDIYPRHGPGAVSTGEDIRGKSNFSRIYRALDVIYPFTEYFMLGLNHVVDQLDYIEGLELLEEPTAKVVLVPKDSRGPRLISCEPLEIQYIQQGIRSNMYDLLESHWLTRGKVNFRDQSINRLKALEGSLHGRLATLDMKDASDRVSLRMVEILFAGVPDVLAALKAARSTRTRLPDGTEVSLDKYAPMGSALCFPVMALVFFALAQAVLRIHGGFTRRKAQEDLWIYGDDIIVDRQKAALLLQHLPSYGLLFNGSKCCVSGFFRESCGCDAYRGVDVTPIRLKETWSHSKKGVSQLVSYVALSNAMWKAGYWRTSNLIKRMVEAHFGPIPYAYKSSDDAKKPSIAWIRPQVCPMTEMFTSSRKLRFNSELQRWERYGHAVRPQRVSAQDDGWQECHRTLLSCGKDPETDTYAVAHRSCLTRKWGPLL